MLKAGIGKYATGYTMANKNGIDFFETREASNASQTKAKIFGVEAQM